MKVYTVIAEHGYFDEMENRDVVGVYSNIGLAGRAALDCFFDIEGRILDRIDKIYNTIPDVEWRLYGQDEYNDSYTEVTILKVTLND